ncbi:hypothetical protein HF992_06205 [Streptococcus ovuberis]|uniref:Phage protein n=1 Tax=Streptococcus ovuberis TaxID=1936207 RepID=A0A7X6N1N0_9STRE|nr:hypothetical protein [Streptococcus ovuberis]
MAEDLLKQILQELQKTDWLGYVVELFAAIIPILYILLTSKKDKNELDNRQKELEERLDTLAKIQINLVAVQEKTEQNLRELTFLAEESRRNTLISLHQSYQLFFICLDKFNDDYRLIEKAVLFKSASDEELQDLILGFFEDIPEYEINNLEISDIPPLCYDEFYHFIRTLNGIGYKNLEHFGQKMCKKFINHEFPKLAIAYEELTRVIK